MLGQRHNGDQKHVMLIQQAVACRQLQQSFVRVWVGRNATTTAIDSIVDTITSSDDSIHPEHG